MSRGVGFLEQSREEPKSQSQESKRWSGAGPAEVGPMCEEGREGWGGDQEVWKSSRTKGCEKVGSASAPGPFREA